MGKMEGMIEGTVAMSIAQNRPKTLYVRTSMPCSEIRDVRARVTFPKTMRETWPSALAYELGEFESFRDVLDAVTEDMAQLVPCQKGTARKMAYLQAWLVGRDMRRLLREMRRDGRWAHDTKTQMFLQAQSSLVPRLERDRIPRSMTDMKVWMKAHTLVKSGFRESCEVFYTNPPFETPVTETVTRLLKLTDRLKCAYERAEPYEENLARLQRIRSEAMVRLYATLTENDRKNGHDQTARARRRNDVIRAGADKLVQTQMADDGTHDHGQERAAVMMACARAELDVLHPTEGDDTCQYI